MLNVSMYHAEAQPQDQMSSQQTEAYALNPKP